MDLSAGRTPLVLAVGSGGVGKTTLAAALALESAAAGQKTLVMTFDPSLRLRGTLGVGDEARFGEVVVEGVAGGRLSASLLDARWTFDRLIERYAPDAAARRRILGNPYYDHLAGHLGGILEYMAVERLLEVSESGRYDRLILDTPPTSQAIDFLEAPARIVEFLESGALKVALAPWFGDDGRLRPASNLGFVGRGLERFLDRVVGLALLRDMSEFFRAFEPLFEGFRRRARQTEQLLASSDALFMLVAGPGEDRIPDTLFFARRLRQGGHHLGPIVVNRVHPQLGDEPPSAASERELAGRQLFHWLGERHQRGLETLRRLLPAEQQVAALPLLPEEPADLASLAALGELLRRALSA